MKRAIILPLLIPVSFYLKAQENPKIGTEKGVKEKLIRIKNGLPDIKKNLTKKDELWENDYNVKFEMGNGMVLFDEDDGEQSLKIRYNKSYFSGSIADYQDYYKALVKMVREVFGAAYDTQSNNKEKKWSTSFYQTRKDIFKSPIRIYVTCSWIFDSLGPDIEIEIYSRLKEPAKENEADDDEG
ncbi:MAG TPA: hypothetical protein VET23_14760 [Chitinophagaceae bacterium]|nr:hypothetical protein [Chitinophagaceae bacterium]